MSVENLSAVGIVTAAVLYMLAFLAHAVEWASVRGTEHPSHEERLRSETWGRMGLNLTVLGAACAAIGVVCRGIAAHRLPWGNMYEFVPRRCSSSSSPTLCSSPSTTSDGWVSPSPCC